MIGHAVEPVIRPLGFNWKIGIGLITSLAAREVIVGTLGTIYGIEGTTQSMGSAGGAAARPDARRGAAALLVFFAFAMQCMSTVAVVRRETGGLALARHPVRLHDGASLTCSRFWRTASSRSGFESELAVCDRALKHLRSVW